jgi:hypothetical protein
MRYIIHIKAIDRSPIDWSHPHPSPIQHRPCVDRDTIIASYKCFGLVYSYIGQRSLERTVTAGREEEISSVVFPTSHERIFFPWRQFRLAYVCGSSIGWQCNWVKANGCHPVGSLLTWGMLNIVANRPEFNYEGSVGKFYYVFRRCLQLEGNLRLFRWMTCGRSDALNTQPLVFDSQVTAWIERFSACWLYLCVFRDQDKF